MGLIESKYIMLMSSRLGRFSKKKDNLYNFRCPYCGDSERHKNKARGYLFGFKSTYTYKCHNCGISKSFKNFLKDFDQGLYDEFVMEKYKQGFTGKGTYTEEPKFNFKKPIFKDRGIVSDLTSISSLNSTHEARAYLEQRHIPDDKLSRFYYCPNFKEWTNSIQHTFDSISYEESRIIIPLYNKEGACFGFQGRSLSSEAKLKYITIILDESIPKVYGLDTVDETKTIYITEGPIDSIFVENSVAMCGADVDISSFGWGDCVYVYDNEPRNREIVNRISRTIDRGDKVVIWPTNVKEKDINDMTIAGHHVNDLLESSTYQGLQAKLKFTDWKKV
jgi:hypothetical protein